MPLPPPSEQCLLWDQGPFSRREHPQRGHWAGAVGVKSAHYLSPSLVKHLPSWRLCLQEACDVRPLVVEGLLTVEAASLSSPESTNGDQNDKSVTSHERSAPKRTKGPRPGGSLSVLFMGSPGPSPDRPGPHGHLFAF